MDRTTLSSLYFLNIVGILESIGYPKARALEVAELEHNLMRSPKVRVCITVLARVFDDASKTLNIDHIGAEVGFRFRVHTFTETGSILALCPTVAAAAHLNGIYQPLTETMGQSRLLRENNRAFLVWTENFDDIERFRHVTELIVAGYAVTTEWLTWSMEGSYIEATFKHDAFQDHQDIIQKVFHGRARFGQERNALEFDPRIIDEKLLTSNPQKLALMRTKLDVIMKNIHGRSEFKEQVILEIRKGLNAQDVSIERVADAVGMSERSLRRALKAEGLKFRDILSDVRRELCNALIRDGYNFTEIAQTLCYNDQSAFNRAFKSWHGVSPKHYKPGNIPF